MKRPYNKPALTYAQQVEQLRQRGMEIADEKAAQFYLQHFNYYRFGAYWLCFEADHGSHKFKPGTKFEDVLNLYIFDRELRLLIMDAMERIEVSVRAQWAYQLGHIHGHHAHLASGLARNKHYWKSNIADLKQEVERSEEVFIKHFDGNYKEQLPPVWAVCEVMSLGLLSRWYRNLKPMHTRQRIANVYGIDEKVLESWLHHLSIVRNMCAHHSRLWDRSFTILPKAPRSKPVYLAYEFIHGRKLYNTLVILLHLMDVVSPRHHWRARLKKLLTDRRVPLDMMDFPADWIGRPVWQEPGEREERKP